MSRGCHSHPVSCYPMLLSPKIILPLFMVAFPAMLYLTRPAQLPVAVAAVLPEAVGHSRVQAPVDVTPTRMATQLQPVPGAVSQPAAEDETVPVAAVSGVVVDDEAEPERLAMGYTAWPVAQASGRESSLGPAMDGEDSAVMNGGVQPGARVSHVGGTGQRSAASHLSRQKAAVALIEESRPLADTTQAVNRRTIQQDVDCNPDNLYMGGNDYARNMLISQGCDPTQYN